MRLPSAIALLASALVGCSAPIAPDSYPGDPLVTLWGEVTSSAPLPPSEVAVVWQLDGPPSTSAMEIGPRTGYPPIEDGAPNFDLRLYDPPPPGVLRQLGTDEPWFARGNAVAMPYYFMSDVGEAVALEDPAFGMHVDHWIVYLESSAPAGSLTAWWLGAPLERGYHQLRVTAVDPTCLTQIEIDACVTALRAAGVPDDETARTYCLADYRLSTEPAPVASSVRLGTYSLPPPPAGCPPP